MNDLVKISMAHHVADVRLNRPEKYNALNPEMILAITSAGRQLALDKSVRAVVLSGEGSGFCAGLDFKEFVAIGAGEPVAVNLLQRENRDPGNFVQMAAMVWKQMPVPVLAALHGVAIGGGLQIALGTDIRLAAPDTRLSVMEISWGIIPDMSITQTLRDLVRIDVAKELTFTARFVEAREAIQIGLVTRVCDNPHAEAHRLAAEIAAKNPHAISAAKQLLDATWHSPSGEGLALEDTLQRTLIGSPNQVEAVNANFEKRAPHFKDRD
ncbi:MAG: crotonase/enoyl-CoA hydratase family protein [Desulfatitalea sp.]|nr:crotonase/enoyl-CoA hydratase family protein [Desulfatitalea sp.]NNK01470.1 crotonase/enoyl-CoA hydratase family protein [Desulfatitalea sp.]